MYIAVQRTRDKEPLTALIALGAAIFAERHGRRASEALISDREATAEPTLNGLMIHRRTWLAPGVVYVGEADDEGARSVDRAPRVTGGNHGGNGRGAGNRRGRTAIAGHWR